MRNQIGFVAIALASGLAAAGCADEHYFCGEGTSAVDGECIGTGGECGPGTHAEGGECVLDDDVVICGDGTEEVDGECVAITETGLPPELDAVTSPTPYPSGGLMILQGDNFALADSGTLIVNVDGVATTNVQVLSNNYALADLPASAVALVEVEIVNDLGDDAMDFHYTGLYAAQGGDDLGAKFVFDPAELHVVDPRTGVTAVVGPITVGGSNVGVTAMKFDADGTLWAIEAVYGGPEAGLMTIDPLTAVATVVAALPPPPFIVPSGKGGSAAYPDLTFIGDTMYAWCEDGDDLTTIDTTTGDVTRIVSTIGSSGSGLAAASDGTLVASFSTDTLTVVDTDGSELGLASLDGTAPTGSIAALTWLNGQLYGVLANGGVGLVRIDVENRVVYQFGSSTMHFDALATPPSLDGTPGGAPETDIIIIDPKARVLADLAPDLDLAAYEPIVATPRPLARPRALAAADVFAPIAARVALDDRGRNTVALTDVANADHVTLHAEAGEITLARGELASYRLVENQRGNLKLVDLQGRAVLRRITAIEAR